MIIYLLRHGDYDKSGSLSELGKKQIKLIAKNLVNENIDAIYCSPIQRCVECSKIINKKLKLEVEFDERIRERDKVLGEPKTQQEKLWWENYLNPSFSSRNPEGCKEFFERVFDFVEELKNKKQSRVLVIAHSALLYAMLYYVYKPQNQLAIWNSLSNGGYVRFEIN
ncbi:MAG: histidine phosphatase family protein [Clostridia bacterium]|nr:histidine phosphatase family protein [Clostridia bacterium]